MMYMALSIILLQGCLPLLMPGMPEKYAVFDQNTREITVRFDSMIDPPKVNCRFILSPDGGQLVSPSTNPCILDLSKDQTIIAKSSKGGTLEYELKAVKNADATFVPDGRERVCGASRMALYENDMLYENKAYVIAANERARFSVMSNRYRFPAAIPQFCQQECDIMADWGCYDAIGWQGARVRVCS